MQSSERAIDVDLPLDVVLGLERLEVDRAPDESKPVSVGIWQ